MAIHPTAIVHKGAEIDASATVGPYCVIGPNVKIGPDTTLAAHVVIENHTTIGARNRISPFVSLGGAPQDLKFKGEPARLIIGDDNVFRESFTANIGTEGGHMETRIGNKCLFMALTHVAHDCIVGDRVIMANSVALAGHVTVEDDVRFAGFVGVHQFCRIGKQAFLTAGALASKDIPPYCIAQGEPARLVGLNSIGLRRSGWKADQLRAAREGFRGIFWSEGTRAAALDKVERELAPHSKEVAEIVAFIRGSQRGVAGARRDAAGDDEALG